MYDASLTLTDFDPELAEALQNEERRQEDHVELIASENYASPLVMAIQNTVFTNKYAEGYPGKRYYSGCENVDVAERLAIERVKTLFDCDYANVQPHAVNGDSKLIQISYGQRFKTDTPRTLHLR